MTTYGCVDMAEYPFDPMGIIPAVTPAQIEAAKPFRVSDFVKLWDRQVNVNRPPYPDNDITLAKAYLARGYTLCTSFDPQTGGFPDMDQTPPVPFYDPATWLVSAGHFVTLCGYDDNINPASADPDHRGGFLMVNSCGDSWNGPMHGYAWISYAWARHSLEAAYFILGGGPTGPVLTGCSATSGKPGDQITLTGTGFGSLRRLAGMTFNGAAASCSQFTNGSITLTVPQSATSGTLAVLDYEGTPSNGIYFEIAF